jgi:SAM-dependent methyltransferase
MTDGNAMWRSNLLQSEIHDRINNDPRTTHDTFLGYPRSRIFSEVIEGGQAEFDQPLGILTGDDRALLYAKFNQQRHLDEQDHGLAQMFGSEGRIVRPTILDVGCGPFTVGLSVAKTLGATKPFRYFGIDRSEAMIKLSERLVAGARERGAFHPETQISFSRDLSAIDFGQSRGELTIVVASYLLASSTLEITPLVTSLVDALSRIGPGPAAVFYTNSAQARATSKFPLFRDELVRNGFVVKVEKTTLFSATKTPKELHYALLFRPAKRMMSV